MGRAAWEGLRTRMEGAATLHGAGKEEQWGSQKNSPSTRVFLPSSDTLVSVSSCLHPTKATSQGSCLNQCKIISFSIRHRAEWEKVARVKSDSSYCKREAWVQASKPKLQSNRMSKGINQDTCRREHQELRVIHERVQSRVQNTNPTRWCSECFHEEVLAEGQILTRRCSERLESPHSWRRRMWGSPVGSLPG